MMPLAPWHLAPALIVPAALVSPAYATQYLSTEAAQKTLFPEATAFVPHAVVLNDNQRAAVEKASGVRLRVVRPAVWRVETQGRAMGWYVQDEVYGKHEFITYAVALDANGAVRGLEILDYRETHGGQIRNPAWRAQFTGKRHGDALRLDQDIQNISGATLSCKHISEGVRRVLAIHHNVLASL